MELESFKQNYKEIVFWEITGEVMSSSKYSETKVWSSGGGGYVGPQGGQVAAPTVQSRAITNHEFWLKTTDGSEKSIQLSDVDIPLREGQKITLICAAEKGMDSGRYAVLINHNAEKYWYIKSCLDLTKDLKFFEISWRLIMLHTFIASVVWALLFGSNEKFFVFIMALMGAGTVFFVCHVQVSLNKYSAYSLLLKDHLEKLTKVLLLK